MSAGQLYLVGIGPGDPDLMTLRAVKIIARADRLVINKGLEKTFGNYIAEKELLFYPGRGWKSPQAPTEQEQADQLLAVAKKRKQTLDACKQAVDAGEQVAFLVRGNPCLFGPLHWIIKVIGRERVTIVPGVDSLAAATALLKQSATESETGRSLIITVPDDLKNSSWHKNGQKERLDTPLALARLGANIVFYMALPQIAALMTSLQEKYPENTPAAVVYHAGLQAKERVITGTISTIANLVADEEEQFLGLLFVGTFLKNDRLSFWERVLIKQENKVQ